VTRFPIADPWPIPPRRTWARPKKKEKRRRRRPAKGIIGMNRLAQMFQETRKERVRRP
jgi:hypothetical protein